MQQEIFQNAQMDLDAIPSLEPVTWTPLQRSYQRMSLLLTCLWTAFFLAVITIGVPLFPMPVWIPLIAYGVVIVLFVIQLISVIRGFPYKGYVLRTHDILYREGWLYKSQVAVPFSRIQHVDIRQGIFERTFGLSKLNIYTAGGQGSDISIPGLLDGDARKLKEFILRETAQEEKTGDVPGEELGKEEQLPKDGQE